jgi:GTPase SAR1 family protein
MQEYSMPNPEVKRYKPGIPDEIICPHCFESFGLWDMLYTGESGETLKATPSFWKKSFRQEPDYPIDSQGHTLRDKLCPKCLHVLPWTAGRQVDLSIGMVGARFSGKSHYVATLVQRLQHEVARDFEAGLIQVDDATNHRYYNEFYSPLYEQKRELGFTQQGAKPLIYNFSINESIWGRNQIDRRSVTLVLYDTAGEDFYNDQNIRIFVKYLEHASGLIFLIDPLQIQKVQERVGATVKLPPITHEGRPENILSAVIGHLQRHNLASQNQKLNIPVAVAFTKCDVLRDQKIIESNRQWNHNIFHQRSYNLELHDDTNGLFCSLLEDWAPASYYDIRTWFRDYALFGLSATGCASDEHGNFPRVAPWRVEDPLLWLLYRLNVIPGA